MSLAILTNVKALSHRTLQMSYQQKPLVNYARIKAAPLMWYELWKIQ